MKATGAGCIQSGSVSIIDANGVNALTYANVECFFCLNLYIDFEVAALALPRAYSLISDILTGSSDLSAAVPGETVKSASHPVSSPSHAFRQQHINQHRPFATV